MVMDNYLTAETLFSDKDTLIRIFSHLVVNRMKKDPMGGYPILKKKLIGNWEATQKNLFLYNPETKQKLLFERFLGIAEDQNVYLVKEETTSRFWVVKWETTDIKRNEEDIEYEKLEKMGAQCPDVLHGFYFLDFGVLVIEFLQPLDSTDRPTEVGHQLLTTQLKYIHEYACYFDLKTDNIRKRNSNPPKYFIIDMNLSKEMTQLGTFHRKHWTPLYASQTFPRVRTEARPLSSYINDFQELLYVLHQLIAQRSYEAKYDAFKYPERFFWNDQIVYDPAMYFADPDRMIKHEVSLTTRGWKLMRRLLEYPLSGTTEDITSRYMAVLNSLQHGFPPANIHSLIAHQLSRQAEDKFFKETEATLALACQVCSKVDSKHTRCETCYHKISFLCSEMCADKHVCK